MARQYTKVLVLSLLWVLLLNCSSTPSDLTTNGSSDLDFTAIGSNVTTLNLSGSTTTLNIENPSVDEDLILIVYGTQTESETAQFSLSTGVPQNEVEQGFQATATEEQETSFHARLMAYEQTLDSKHKILNTDFQATAEELVVGDEDTMLVMNSLDDFDATTTVQATLLYQTAAFNFFVDNDALDAMSEENISVLCEDFDAVIDAMHANFGHESDINGDGRFDILATPVVNQLGDSVDSFTSGFFFAKDLYAVEGSNQREIFYTAIPDPSGEYGFAVTEEFAFSNVLPTTLPHEFQHMINHNEKVFELNAETEVQWLNEALSHLAEDIYSTDADGYMTQTGIENPARIDIYQAQTAEVCFVCDTDLAARGGSYLFLRSLYEAAEQGEFSDAASGRELLQRLVQTSRTGEDNVIHATFGETAAEGDFQDLVGRFALVLYFATLDGVDLTGYQNDNRHTQLDGVNLLQQKDENFITALSGSAVMYIQIRGEELVANDGEVVLEYDAGHFSGFLIGE